MNDIRVQRHVLRPSAGPGPLSASKDTKKGGRRELGARPPLMGVLPMQMPVRHHRATNNTEVVGRLAAQPAATSKTAPKVGVQMGSMPKSLVGASPQKLRSVPAA